MVIMNAWFWVESWFGRGSRFGFGSSRLNLVLFLITILISFFGLRFKN